MPLKDRGAIRGILHKRLMSQAQAPRILILEDEPLIAMELEATLEDMGYEVIGPVASCEAALELIWSKTVDAAVLDLMIGEGTCEVVANELTLSGIPWAFATGFDTHELQERFSDAPVLSKPTDEDRLKQVMSSLVPRLT